ncbi:MACPF domain-containing protein CAD1 [Amborella trichopoda]|nr:MACPF domain-containing protein CAD1 [Amborella trichopoda]|eukprot:XP_020521687.1 MACPF domain-containing protein CAD1 [Amborella trichopoda]
MEENAAAFHTAQNSIQALGRGFDVCSDTRLLYCKGSSGSRIVEIDEEHSKNLEVCEGLIVPNVSREIKSSEEKSEREITGVCRFYEMAERFNKKAQLPGCVPLGSFNSVFSLTGSRKTDAAATKSLAMDGYIVPLFKVRLTKFPLILQEDVKRAVPSSWDPSALACFIENFGTHVVTSVTIGGKDVIYVKQHISSHLSTTEIKNYVQDVGDQRFSVARIRRTPGPMKFNDKAVDSFPFNSQGIHPQPSTTPYLIGKEFLYIPMNFVLCNPTCLLFFIPQVTIGRKPMTGLRLCLEGPKRNRLCIHARHLSTVPRVLRPHWDPHIPIGPPTWVGPEEQDSRWFIPVRWSRFCHVSAAPVEPKESHIGALSGALVVTGAHLGVWNFGPRSVLYLRLLYSRVPGCTIRRSVWDHASAEKPENSEKSENSDGVHGKLAKLVDLEEMVKGAEDSPGHWVLTGAKLGVEKGRICLRGKYSLLNY